MSNITISDEAKKHLIDTLWKIDQQFFEGRQPEDEQVISILHELVSSSNAKLVEEKALLKEQIRVADVAFQGLHERHQELVEENTKLKDLLKRINEQLESPSRNTTSSYRRDGSVIISSDIREEVKAYG